MWSQHPPEKWKMSVRFRPSGPNMDITFDSPPPKEEGQYLFYDKEYGTVKLFTVVEHLPFVYAMEKTKKKLNPNNNTYFGVIEHRYKNVKGYNGKWSSKLNIIYPEK